MKNLKIIIFLLTSGASLSLLSISIDEKYFLNHHEKPLLQAVIKKDVPEIEKLLKQGRDPNLATDANGKTALHIILDSPYFYPIDEEIVNLLLSYGADATILAKNGMRKGENAIDAARFWNNKKVINLFKEMKFIKNGFDEKN
jgi:ankyrin repeat protein